MKPFVKRQKNDAADAEAVTKAALRPTMRTVPVKISGQQARTMLFRTRELSAGHGVTASKGMGSIDNLVASAWDQECYLPDLIRDMNRVHLTQIARVTDDIGRIERRIAVKARRSDVVRRLRTMPGAGPICALAIETFAPPLRTLRARQRLRGPAWPGAARHSNSGQQRPGRTSRMGQRDIRRLPIIGAMAVVRWRSLDGRRPRAWLAGLPARRHAMPVAIALADRMAHMIGAMLVRREDDRDPKGAIR